MNKDLAQLVRRVGKVWPIEMLDSGRVKVMPPGGDIIFIAASSQDFHAVHNTEARLRRAGFYEAEAEAFGTNRPPPIKEIDMRPESRNGTPGPSPIPPAPDLSASPSPPAPAAPPSLEPAGVGAGVGDPHLLGLVRLGRLIDRLPKDTTTQAQFLNILALADQLGLTIHDVRQALDLTEAE